MLTQLVAKSRSFLFLTVPKRDGSASELLSVSKQLG